MPIIRTQTGNDDESYLSEIMEQGHLKKESRTTKGKLTKKNLDSFGQYVRTDSPQSRSQKKQKKERDHLLIKQNGVIIKRDADFVVENAFPSQEQSKSKTLLVSE